MALHTDYIHFHNDDDGVDDVVASWWRWWSSMSTSAPRRLTPWRRGCGGSSSTSCRGCSAWRDQSMTRTDTGEHDINTGRYLIYLVLDIWIYVTCRYLLLIFAFYYWWLNLLIGFNFAWKLSSNQICVAISISISNSAYLWDIKSERNIETKRDIWYDDECSRNGELMMPPCRTTSISSKFLFLCKDFNNILKLCLFMTCHFVHHPASASILCPEDRNGDIWINLSASKLSYFTSFKSMQVRLT